MARVVLDTGVVVSALLRHSSVPAEAVARVLAEHISLMSRSPLVEYTDVLRRPKFERVMEPITRQRLLQRFAASAFFVEVKMKVDDCRDPKDNFLLALALDGRADYLVTGDADLLVLDPWRGVRIVTPVDFLVAVQA